MISSRARVYHSPETSAGKLCKAVAVDVHGERPEAGDKHVKAEVELLAADEVRIGDVPLDHVGRRFCRVVPSGRNNDQMTLCSAPIGGEHSPLVYWAWESSAKGALGVGGSFGL